MGAQKPGQIPGDVTVVLKARKERSDLEWKRLGNDLRVQVNLTLREALLGFTRKVTHLDGHSEFGDLYVQMGIKFPKELSKAHRMELENVRSLSDDFQQECTVVDASGRTWKGPCWYGKEKKDE